MSIAVTTPKTTLVTDPPADYAPSTSTRALLQASPPPPPPGAGVDCSSTGAKLWLFSSLAAVVIAGRWLTAELHISCFRMCLPEGKRLALSNAGVCQSGLSCILTSDTTGGTLCNPGSGSTCTCSAGPLPENARCSVVTGQSVQQGCYRLT